MLNILKGGVTIVANILAWDFMKVMCVQYFKHSNSAEGGKGL